jgi:SPP1 gp7 family putative phage head morphogenesis protein
VTTNSRLVNAAIDHQVYVEQYKKTVVDTITQKLRGTSRELQRTIRGTPDGPGRDRLTALLTEVEGLIGQYYAGVRDHLTGGEARTFADTVATLLSNSIGDSIPIAVSVVQPSPQQVFAAAMKQTFDGLTISELIGDQERKVVNRFSRSIKQSYLEGAGSAEAARRALGTVVDNLRSPEARQWRNSVRALTRTGLQNLAAAARERVYADNTDLIKGVEWVSTLDSRTSPICQARDGKVYDVNDGPRPPAHWNCRSTTVPVVKSWRELGVDLDEAPAGTRASMDGQVAAGQNYEGWLRSLSEARQLEILGETKFALFRNGTPLTAFVADDATPLTIAQIRDRFGIDETTEDDLSFRDKLAQDAQAARERYEKTGDIDRYVDDIIAVGATVDDQYVGFRGQTARYDQLQKELADLKVRRDTEKDRWSAWGARTMENVNRLVADGRIPADQRNRIMLQVFNKGERWYGRTIAPIQDEYFLKLSEVAKESFGAKAPSIAEVYDFLDDRIGLNPEHRPFIDTFIGVKTPRGLLRDAERWFPMRWGDYAYDGPTRVTIPADSRSAYNPKRRLFEISTNADTPTAIHEFCHYMEHNHPTLNAVERRFYERRTAGESLQLLSEVTGNPSYDPTEVCRPDEFFKAYCGRDYSKSGPEDFWEIFSMGYEAIVTSRIDIDAEYRRLIFGILAVL